MRLSDFYRSRISLPSISIPSDVDDSSDRILDVYVKQELNEEMRLSMPLIPSMNEVMAMLYE